LRPAEPTDCDEFADKPDSEDPGVGVGGQSPAEPEPGVAEDGVQVAGGDQPAVVPEAEDDGYHYRQDAIGRWYKYDHYGNRVFNKPLRGSLCPPSIPLKEWQKLSKKSQQAVHNTWRQLEDAKVKAEVALKGAKAESAAASASSSSSAAAAGRKRKGDTPTTTNTQPAQHHNRLAQSAMLMMTVLGSMCAGGAETHHIKSILDAFLASHGAPPGDGGEEVVSPSGAVSGGGGRMPAAAGTEHAGDELQAEPGSIGAGGDPGADGPGG